MGTNSGPYKFVFVLHLLAVIIGFGSVFLLGVFGAKAQKRGGTEGVAVAEVTVDVARHWSEWFIYAVPILGIILILLSDDAWKFSQAWISASLLLYIVGLGLVHAVHYPNLNRMNALAAELNAGGPAAPGSSGGPPPQVAELEQRGKKAALVGGFLNLIVVVVVFLMVWKPGV
jgi:uncharacterized membrane protein